ncbi:MAG: hypothetical protein H8Z69_05585 [Nanohaloarchaea archaeon]|nr:hypothetical protein [Candidatus Nanohaloarchaea archaeon]
MSELNRLLMPMVDGKPKYKERVRILSVNHKVGEDSVVVEVSEDDENLEWLLQARDVYELDYDGFITNSGPDGPPGDGRTPYKPNEKDRDAMTQRPEGYTIDQIENVDLELRKVREEDMAQDDLYRHYEALEKDWDLSNPKVIIFNTVVKGDKVVLGKIRYIYFPNENLMTCDFISISKPYTKTKVFHKTYDFGLKNHPGYEVEEELVCSYCDKSRIIDRLKMDYEKILTLENKQNICWFRRLR